MQMQVQLIYQYYTIRITVLVQQVATTRYVKYY